MSNPEASKPERASSEHLVLVHPHATYDGSQTIVGYSELCLETFSERPESVLVLQGYKEDSRTRARTNELLSVYIDTAHSFPTVCSVSGEIDQATLKNIVTPNITVSLLGGIVGQCHANAFRSIAQFLDEFQIEGVTISIPYDGCYFQHAWVEWRNSVGPSWNLEHRFDGVQMGGYIYEMSGKDSYSLREVASRVFTEPDHLLHHLQIRDQSGNPLIATQAQFRENLERHFLDCYFQDPRGEPYFARKYTLEYSENDLRIIFV